MDDPSTRQTAGLALQTYEVRSSRDKLAPWTESIFAGTSVLGIVLFLVFRSFDPLLITAIGLGCLIESDVPFTRSRRFGKQAQPTIVASETGVEGDAYPLHWYTSDRGRSSRASRRPVVVRSRFVRLVAERAERPNFLNWSSATIVVFPHERWILASFWGEYPPADNPIFHGVEVVVPPSLLPRFLQLASLGGADLHITMDLLSETGSRAAIYCARHSRKERLSNFPIYLPRVGKSGSISDYVSWVRQRDGVGRQATR